MFSLLFGLFWTAVVTPIFVMCLVIPAEQRHGAEMDPLLFIVFVIFELIGLYMIYYGLKRIIKDRKTKRHGVQCYGIIYDIQFTGTYYNDKPEYKAVVYFVNPETYQLENLEEIIGFDNTKYPIKSYVLCKYYQGDINIENIVSENEIPGDTKRKIDAILSTINTNQGPNYSNLEFSEDREEVVIDGITYKRVE